MYGIVDPPVRPKVPERRLSAEKSEAAPVIRGEKPPSSSAASLGKFPPLEGMENDLSSAPTASVKKTKTDGPRAPVVQNADDDDDDASTDIASNLYQRPPVNKKASLRSTHANQQPDRVQRHLEALEVKYKDILTMQ
jgi:hypothetical protein